MTLGKPPAAVSLVTPNFIGWYITAFLITVYSFITNETIPRSKALPEKLTVQEPVKKFLELYGTRKFITAFTTARHLSLF